MIDSKAALTLAVGLARQAGALLRNGLARGTAVARKSSPLDLVTEYDRAAERIIAAGLRSAFPDHSIHGEEGGRLTSAESAFLWHVDPLDGTTNFAHGFPVFAVSIALYHGQSPLLGVVYDPTRDECFRAIAGMGSVLEKGGQQIPLSVSRESELASSLLATGFPYDIHTSELDNIAQTTAFLKRARGLRRAGAAALDLAYVAAGRLDGYWEYKLNSWDVAAGALLVTEAGGQVTGIGGAPFQLAPRVDLVASNGRIQAAMLELLAAV
jgi:myo-inositol-1(or 4)-monophosphatase